NVSGDSLSAAGDLGVAPGAVTYAPARNAFFVPNTTTDAVTSIQYSTTQVGASAVFIANAATLTLPVGSNPVASVFGSTEAYILNAGSGAICPNFSVVAISTNSVTSSICVGSAPTYGVQTGNNV